MYALVAEDSRTQAYQLKALLESHDFEVEVAVDGDEALESARARTPDVVISDIVMPKRDGYALCRALKQDAVMHYVPIMLVTALAEPLDVVRALAAGADNFVTKPYDEDQLIRRVLRTLTRKAPAPAAPSSAVLGSTQITVGGESFEITADREQVLGVLVSALEDMSLRNAELEANRAELAQATARRDEVLDVVSHELRGPLSVLLWAADEFASSAVNGAPTSKQRAFATRVARQARKMIAIADDLLDISRIEAGELRVGPAPADLVGVVREVIERIRPSLSQHTIELRAQPSLVANIDVDRIEQALMNYLSNAIKYSPSGGRILVTIEREGEREAERATVAVTDQGIGIPASALPSLFQRYFRAPGAEQAAKGIGVGLYVTRRLVEAHGGTVGVRSEQGVGSTFSFSIPLRADPA